MSYDKFPEWINRKRRRTDRSRVAYQGWLTEAEWLTEQGTPSEELDAAVARVGSTLWIEYWHLNLAKYDEEFQEPQWKDAELIEIYRKNTLDEIRKLKLVLDKIHVSAG
jgi:hypothetical protein